MSDIDWPRIHVLRAEITMTEDRLTGAVSGTRHAHCMYAQVGDEAARDRRLLGNLKPKSFQHRQREARPTMTPDELRAARRNIIQRYARKDTAGKSRFCGPSRREKTTGYQLQGPGTNGKPIYPDRESAEAAAREFEAIGDPPLRAYACRRSKKGHFHLTGDNTRKETMRG